MAELQGILRVEVKKRVDLQAQWEEMKRESTATVVPIVQGARKQGASSAGTKEVPRTYSEAAQKEKETAGLVEPNLLPVVNGGGSNVVPGEGGQPLAGRRALVVGDSNVARIVEGVLGKVKEDKRVRVEAQPGKYMVDAIAKAEEVLWDSMEGENLVLIHAGLNDVLNGRSQNLGKQIEAGLDKLGAVSERVHVEICTIPRVRGQSLDIERRVIEANRVIKGMSRRLGYGVKEINWEVYADGSCPFTRGGIHYSPDTASQTSHFRDDFFLKPADGNVRPYPFPDLETVESAAQSAFPIIPNPCPRPLLRARTEKPDKQEQQLAFAATPVAKKEGAQPGAMLSAEHHEAPVPSPGLNMEHGFIRKIEANQIHRHYQ
ncbi:hypothetical protein HPB47_028145, partial [Ixodes persulcatus]